MALPVCHSLLLDRRRSQLHIRLNRPETRNALTRDMVQELLAVVAFLEGASDIGLVVVRGAGGTFCAGGDIKGFLEQTQSPIPAPGEADSIAVNNRHFGTFLTRFDELPQTVVMAIEGAAFGGGLGLAAIGDVALCTADARFAMSETGLGVVPAQIAPFVAARIGVSQTRRIALTGRRFDGREAARIGLVHDVCEGQPAFEARLTDLVGEIARCAPGANAATKRLLLASRTTPLPALLDQASEAFAAALRGPEGREGVTAFLDRRKPSWAGGGSGPRA
ncbi:MAG TPA: enoyl-CoA hydratase/isomerase family protein [Xanthobacteraceae bacterium]|nr:enoyl-CoA hydratase/isomerase family protein [Xanthobacteraceae bacterium]